MPFAPGDHTADLCGSDLLRSAGEKPSLPEPGLKDRSLLRLPVSAISCIHSYNRLSNRVKETKGASPSTPPQVEAP